MAYIDPFTRSHFAMPIWPNERWTDWGRKWDVGKSDECFSHSRNPNNIPLKPNPGASTKAIGGKSASRSERIYTLASSRWGVRKANRIDFHYVERIECGEYICTYSHWWSYFRPVNSSSFGVLFIYSTYIVVGWHWYWEVKA